MESIEPTMGSIRHVNGALKTLHGPWNRRSTMVPMVKIKETMTHTWAVLCGGYINRVHMEYGQYRQTEIVLQ